MPCYDPDDSCYPRTRTVIAYVDNPKLEAALCGVLSALENNGYMELLDRVDWKEAGVNQEWLLKWWKKHKKADERRRIRETNKMIGMIDAGLKKKVFK